MGEHHPAWVFDVLHHQVSQGLQVERGITGDQGHAATGNATGRDLRVERAGFTRALAARRAAVQQVDTAHGRAAQLHVAAQVDQHAVTVVRGGGHAGGVQRAADADTQIAATGQLLAAIGGDPSGTADGQNQALAVGVHFGAINAVPQGIQHPGVAAHIDVQVAAAQGAEAGETEQFVRRRGCGVTAEVDPPGRRLRRPARRHGTAALAP